MHFTDNPDLKQAKEFFSFPETPYPSQVEFMNSVLDSANGGKLAFLESPTGTVYIFDFYHFSIYSG